MSYYKRLNKIIEEINKIELKLEKIMGKEKFEKIFEDVIRDRKCFIKDNTIKIVNKIFSATKMKEIEKEEIIKINKKEKELLNELIFWRQKYRIARWVDRNADLTDEEIDEIVKKRVEKCK